MRHLIYVVLLASLACSQGCGIIGTCVLLERKARAEERRTGIMREYKMEEPWDGKSGD